MESQPQYLKQQIDLRRLHIRSRDGISDCDTKFCDHKQERLTQNYQFLLHRYDTFYLIFSLIRHPRLTWINSVLSREVI